MTLNPSINITDPAIFCSLCNEQMTVLAYSLGFQMGLTVR